MATSWVTVAANAVHVETGAAYAPAIGLDLQNVRDVVGRQAFNLSSVRFHEERHRLRDASFVDENCVRHSI